MNTWYAGWNPPMTTWSAGWDPRVAKGVAYGVPALTALTALGAVLAFRKGHPVVGLALGAVTAAGGLGTAFVWYVTKSLGQGAGVEIGTGAAASLNLF